MGYTQKNFKKEHFKIIKKFYNVLKESSEGILLSGSTSWGSDYALTSKSDIDLLILMTTVNKLGDVIRSLIRKNLIDSYEIERFHKFRDLYKKNEADQFSLISKELRLPVSLDFIFPSNLDKITEMLNMKSYSKKGVKIRVIKEFRINPPKIEGYSLDDLKGNIKIIHHPKFKEIKKEKRLLGYISETLVDGQSKSTYLMGVMSFFLSIKPLILLDKKGLLAKSINKLRCNISIILKGQRPKYITRQERMNKETLKEIKDSLINNPKI